MKAMQITLLALVKAEIETTSARALAIAKEIVSELLSTPTPRVSRWRQHHTSKLLRLHSHTERNDAARIVDVACETATAMMIRDARSFDELSRWLSSSPMSWIDWDHLPSWGLCPETPAHVFTCDERSQLAWIEGEHGPEITTYQEMMGDAEPRQMEALRAEAEEAIDNIISAFAAPTWDHSTLGAVTDLLNIIEGYLDERHYGAHPSTRDSAADYLPAEIGEACLDAVTADGFEIMPPNAVDSGWHLEMI